MKRRGASLAELLVALTILGIGGSLATRVLWLATRDLESAEVGLRAVLLLSEVADPRVEGDAVRVAGPGRLVAESDGPMGWTVRYESPEAGVDTQAGGGGPEAASGFLESRSWVLEVEG